MVYLEVMVWYVVLLVYHYVGNTNGNFDLSIPMVYCGYRSYAAVMVYLEVLLWYF